MELALLVASAEGGHVGHGVPTAAPELPAEAAACCLVEHLLRLQFHSFVGREPLTHPECCLVLGWLRLAVCVADALDSALAHQQLLLHVSDLLVAHQQLPRRGGERLYCALVLVNRTHFGRMGKYVLVMHFVELAHVGVVGRLLEFAHPAVGLVDGPRCSLLLALLFVYGFGIQGCHVVYASFDDVFLVDAEV